jgi:hypothetical protein
MKGIPIAYIDENNKRQDIGGVNGATKVSPIAGTGEATKNRLNNPDATYAEATNSMTWTAEENVTQIYITLFADAAALEIAGGTAGDYGAPQAESHGWAVFDAINSAAEVALLGDAGGAAVDVQLVPLVYGKRMGPFIGTSYFTRLGLDASVNSKVFVEAQ